MSPKRTHPFNVLLSQGEIDTLKQIADARGVSIAWIIRSALGSWVAMAINNTPTCATGTPCPFRQTQPMASAPAYGGQAAFAAPPAFGTAAPESAKP